MNNKFINLEQACELLNLSKSTLYKRTHNKTIPFYKCGSKLLFIQEELIQYVLDSKVTSKIKKEQEEDSFLITSLAA